MAYYNVNVKPPRPNLPDEKISEIRKLLKESMKKWHYIKASDMRTLISLLNETIAMISRD